MIVGPESHRCETTTVFIKVLFYMGFSPFLCEFRLLFKNVQVNEDYKSFQIWLNENQRMLVLCEMHVTDELLVVSRELLVAICTSSAFNVLIAQCIQGEYKAT